MPRSGLPRNRYLTIGEKRLICIDYRHGVSVPTITNKYRVSRATVYRCIKNVDRKKPREHFAQKKQKLTVLEKLVIKLALARERHPCGVGLMAPYNSTQAIANEVVRLKVRGKISRFSVQRILKKCGLKFYVRQPSTINNEQTAKRRLEFANFFIQPEVYPKEDEVVFQDEFWTFINKEEWSRGVWQRPGNEVPVRLHCRASPAEKRQFVIFFTKTWRRIFQLEGSLDSRKFVQYCQQLLPLLRGKIMVMDGASCHSSHYTKEWFKKNNIRSVQWMGPGYPPRSPRFNRAELMIAHTKRLLEAMHPTKATLLRCTTNAFNQVPQSTVDKLFAGWRKEFERCIQRQGRQWNCTSIFLFVLTVFLRKEIRIIFVWSSLINFAWKTLKNKTNFVIWSTFFFFPKKKKEV